MSLPCPSRTALPAPANEPELDPGHGELVAARSMLRTVVDRLPAAVFWKDARGRFQGCNQAFAAQMGLAPRDLVGRHDRELLEPAEFAIYAEEDAHVLSGEGDLIGRVVQVPRSDGHGWTRTSKVALRDDAGRITGLLGITEDITERRELQLRLERLALHDALTGLPNRAQLEDRLAEAVARANQDEGGLAVLYFDIDHFKQVNDRHGHEAGDRVIQAVAERAAAAVRDTDLVARIGGDEFVVVLEGATHPTTVRSIAESLRAAIMQPLALDDTTTLGVGTSIGGALHAPGMGAGDLLRQSDAAMYAAKQSGRGRVVLAQGEPRRPLRPPAPPRSQRPRRIVRARR